MFEPERPLLEICNSARKIVTSREFCRSADEAAEEPAAPLQRRQEEQVHPGPNELVAQLSDALIAVARSSNQSEHVPYPPKLQVEELTRREPVRRESIRALEEVRPMLRDVERTVQRYTDQDRFLRGFGLGVPVFLVGDDYVPVDLEVDNWGYLSPSTVDSAVRNFAEAPNPLPSDVVEPDRAESGFRRGLQRFLATRLFPAHGKPAGPTAPVGYDFEVATKTPGLQINYSPAYFVNRNLVFGVPSTPVRQYMQPGRFIFGAYPPDEGYWSSPEYDVPGPTSSAYLDI